MMVGFVGITAASVEVRLGYRSSTTIGPVEADTIDPHQAICLDFVDGRDGSGWHRSVKQIPRFNVCPQR
jgi:hypothetical protein